MNTATHSKDFLQFPVLMTFTILVMCFEAITKGWFMFYVIPLLLLAVPILLVVQIWNRKTQKREAHPLLVHVARLQIISALVFYICMPGLYDTEVMNMFGFWSMDQSNPIVLLSALVAAVAALVFVTTTVQAFVLLVRTRHIPKKLP